MDGIPNVEGMPNLLHMDTYQQMKFTLYIIRWHSIAGYSVVGYSRRYCREYPTGNLEFGIPAVGYSVREPLQPIASLATNAIVHLQAPDSSSP